MAGRGRPKQEVTRDFTLGVRLSKDELERLNFICNDLGITKSQYIRAIISYQCEINPVWRAFHSARNTSPIVKGE